MFLLGSSSIFLTAPMYPIDISNTTKAELNLTCSPPPPEICSSTNCLHLGKLHYPINNNVYYFHVPGTHMGMRFQNADSQLSYHFFSQWCKCLSPFSPPFYTSTYIKSIDSIPDVSISFYPHCYLPHHVRPLQNYSDYFTHIVAVLS